MNYMVRRYGYDLNNRRENVFAAENAYSRPNVDIAESAEAYEILVELPGFSADDLDIQIKENLLTLTAEKSARDTKKEEKKAAKEEKTYLKRERSSGAYKRSFALPKDADADKIEARLDNGLLTLTVAKKEEAQPRTIGVNLKSA